ncbi:DUF6745 domain-containing protein [Calothrix sp. NIES-2098]|uniref:DUF6745 domain-containing protein n=1 Tax=Calothrix sp. NIES-2098 TaxID=1954171 RepID=UPI0030D7537E
MDTSPTDKQQAEAAICLAYECVGLKPPQKIMWFDNPLAAVSWMVGYESFLGHLVKSNLWWVRKDIDTAINLVVNPIVRQIIEDTFLYDMYPAFLPVRDLFDLTWNNICDVLNFNKSNFIIALAPYEYPTGVFDLQELVLYAYFNAIGIDCSKLKGLWHLTKYCGWWWSFKEIAVVTSKPLTIRFDADKNLHGEGIPAIAYEGFNIYAYHGVILPEKYGKLHPKQWQARWLLEEDNAELRRVLIQGIGYAKITHELQAVELDTWQEYTLLKIDKDVDMEPIVLLKMTCPSTDFIHILRVPPDVKSAREAISWVNWGIDSEDFSVQT